MSPGHGPRVHSRALDVSSVERQPGPVEAIPTCRSLDRRDPSPVMNGRDPVAVGARRYPRSSVDVPLDRVRSTVKCPGTEPVDAAALLEQSSTCRASYLDEGVDACSLGVEVVGDRPLLIERRDTERRTPRTCPTLSSDGRRHRSAATPRATVCDCEPYEEPRHRRPRSRPSRTQYADVMPTRSDGADRCRSPNARSPSNDNVARLGATRSCAISAACRRSVDPPVARDHDDRAASTRDRSHGPRRRR